MNDLDISNLIMEIKKEALPKISFDIINKEESGYCMSFDYDNYINPEKSAYEWLDEKRKNYPDYINGNGYHVVRSERYSKIGELALKAAAVLELIVKEKN